jgi:hypothetical protein
MSTGAIIAIVIAIIVVVAAGALATMELRRRTLRQRFGPEYERLASEKGTRQAEAELMARQRRVAKLDIKQLTPEQRADYERRWTAVQEEFVNDPVAAVRQAEELVTAVQRDRGYPVDDSGLSMDALAVHNSRAVGSYRSARAVASNGTGTSTDDLRDALINYRVMFRDLIGRHDGDRALGSRTPVGVPSGDRIADEPDDTHTTAESE